VEDCRLRRPGVKGPSIIRHAAMTLTVKEPRRRVFERSRARTAGGHAALLTQAGGTTRDGQTTLLFSTHQGWEPRGTEASGLAPTRLDACSARTGPGQKSRDRETKTTFARQRARARRGQEPARTARRREGVAAGLTSGSALCSTCRCGALVASLSRCSWSRSVKTQDSRLTHPSTGSATPSTAAHPCLPVCQFGDLAAPVRLPHCSY
jgi:hypothetical protein